MSLCKTCMYHAKRDKCIYCTLNHYFPRKEIIAFMGCTDYKKETIDLFNWHEKKSHRKEN